jgi:hypothetical protein
LAFLSSGFGSARLGRCGSIRKVAVRNRYTLTNLGYRAALYLTKLHERLLAPGLDSLDLPLRGALVSAHELDHAVARRDADLTALAQICGLEVAA